MRGAGGSKNQKHYKTTQTLEIKKFINKTKQSRDDEVDTDSMH